MDSVIETTRLRLTLVTKTERGSPELEWCHELRSNEKATWWSIYGQSKTIEATEKAMEGVLPTSEGARTYRVVYAVHEALDSADEAAEGKLKHTENQHKLTRFIGLITLRSLDDKSLALPEHLTLPAAAATTTLTIELGYLFLPMAWGKGYATESLQAAFEACREATSFWTPYAKLYVFAIVNEENPASLRVMAKTGMTEKGVYEWTGKAVWLAGQWTERSNLHIFGKHLLE